MAATTTRPRPRSLPSETTKLSTELGNLYVTICLDDDGQPFEVSGVRRVTRHRIPSSIRRNSEEIPGPTDPPRSESLGESSMSVKRLRPEGVVRPVPQGPRDMVKAGLLEPQSLVGV